MNMRESLIPARDGKPRRRAVERIRSFHLDDAASHFEGPELKAYYFANVIESASCWPRVLKGLMTNERFHERTARMKAAILRVTE